MIISGGENIYSPEVERVLAEHPAVIEVAIIGVPDDTWGESVKAVVSLNEGASATEEELIAYCREQLAHFKCPKTVDITGPLPRNPTGKILKKNLRAPYWEGRDRRSTDRCCFTTVCSRTFASHGEHPVGSGGFPASLGEASPRADEFPDQARSARS